MLCARWPRRVEVTAGHGCGEHPGHLRLAIAGQCHAALLRRGEGVPVGAYYGDDGRPDAARNAAAEVEARRDLAKRALAHADALIAAVQGKGP